MKKPDTCSITVISFAALCTFSSGCSSWRPRVSLPEPSPVVLEGNVCAGIDNSERCARAIEDRKLPLTATLVRRSGERLCLRLESGTEKCLEPDVNDTDSSVSYSYLGTLPKPRFHVIWTQYYEGSSILLVHAKTGKTYFVDDIPTPSPDGRRLAVASLDLEAHYNPNSLEILRADGDQLVSEWRLEPDGWGPGLPTWQAPGLVSFPQMALRAETERPPSEIGSWQVTKSRGRWTGKVIDNTMSDDSGVAP